MTNWNILDTGSNSAIENMRIDKELLGSFDQPTLHFYEWQKQSATYGHFVKPGDFLKLDEVEKRDIDLAQRPTGGGIVFHIWDFAFSVLVPEHSPLFSQNTLENYAFVNQAVLNAVSEFLEVHGSLELIKEDFKPLDASCTRFCMAQPTKYDVVLHGRKIAGSAQRKTKQGFLHQGTIALKMPDETLLRAILRSENVLEAMKASTFALLKENESIEEGRALIKKLLQKHLLRELQHVTKN